MARHAPREPVLVAYALQGERLVHVSQVVGGLACRCTCASCGQPMTANKKSGTRRHHFAHAQASACDGGVETVLRRVAKALLAELPSMRLPEYRYRRTFTVYGHGSVSIDQVVAPATRIALDEVYLEQPLGTVVSDAILEPAARRLLVEITVAGAVSRATLRTVRRLGLALLQVRLQPADAARPPEALKVKLDTDDAAKEWLFDPRQREAERTWLQRRRELVRVAQRVRQARDVVMNQALERARREPLPEWMKASAAAVTLGTEHRSSVRPREATGDDANPEVTDVRSLPSRR